MGDNLQDVVNREGKMKDEPAMWIKSDNSAVYGKLILTSKRLFFIRNSTESNSSVLHFFSGDHATDPVLEIDLDTINALSQGTYMVDKNILVVNYMQYETARFSVIHYQEWEDAIHTQQNTPHIERFGTDNNVTEG